MDVKNFAFFYFFVKCRKNDIKFVGKPHIFDADADFEKGATIDANAESVEIPTILAVLTIKKKRQVACSYGASREH